MKTLRFALVAMLMAFGWSFSAQAGSVATVNMSVIPVAADSIPSDATNHYRGFRHCHRGGRVCRRVRVGTRRVCGPYRCWRQPVYRTRCFYSRGYCHR